MTGEELLTYLTNMTPEERAAPVLVHFEVGAAEHIGAPETIFHEFDCADNGVIRISVGETTMVDAATFDANVERLKACEHIAEGEEGWQTLRNLCPSTAAVATLRERFDAQVEEIQRLRAALRPFAISFQDEMFLWSNDDLERFSRQGIPAHNPRYDDGTPVYLVIAPGEDQEDRSDDSLFTVGDLRGAAFVLRSGVNI